MRYVMKQKLFSWGDDFTIRDADGRDAFFVDGKGFDGIDRGGALAVVVKKKMFTLFRCRFTVEVPGPDDLEASGDFLEDEYSFDLGGWPRELSTEARGLS